MATLGTIGWLDSLGDEQLIVPCVVHPSQMNTDRVNFCFYHDFLNSPPLSLYTNRVNFCFCHDFLNSSPLSLYTDRVNFCFVMIFLTVHPSQMYADGMNFCFYHDFLNRGKSTGMYLGLYSPYRHHLHQDKWYISLRCGFI